MIIWSGLGILIPIVAILGIIGGTLMATVFGQPVMGPGLGMGVAAFANWGLWKLVYPKQPRILVDPKTGRQMLMTPNHSLFFIPAKAWTWILAVLAVPVLFLGIMGARKEASDVAKPGHKEFTEANRMIASNSHGEVHGNTDTAKSAAKVFATTMKAMTDVAFSGGSKKNFMTGGDFLTYCHDGADAIVILCHVPSLRSYKSDESKSALADISWNAARAVSDKLDPDHKKTLMVGLRGITSYGGIQKGATTDGAIPEAVTDLHDTSIFYPAFVAAENP